MIGRAEALLFVVAVSSAAGAAARIAHVRSLGSERPVAVTRTPTPFTTADEDSITQAASNTVDNDPFRLANRPADVRFDARADGGVARSGVIPTAMRPTFVVRAIVGGPPWQAILDGIPGQPAGTIVRAGTTFEKLAIRTISADTVVVQAPDTTWKLTLKHDRP